MESAAGQPRILFVEDERSISEPFSKALVREGFEPVTAFTAAEALALADRMEFDLVLLDLNLPDMSAFEILAELRARPATSQVPVAIVSADATPAQATRAMAAGAAAYLSKPIAVPDLLALVDSTLVSRTPAADPAAS